MQAETQHMLLEYTGLDMDQCGVWLRYRQYLDARGQRLSYQELPQLMTSWGLLYNAFRSAFPAERYHEGATLEDFEADPAGVTATFTGLGQRRCDLLVGADGSRSFVRSRVAGEVAPRYAGYVAWRGVVPESEADPSLRAMFEDHFTFQQMPHSHILCYLIPGAQGQTERGQRRFNWVWYWNVPEAELPSLMTGADGKIYEFALPPGQVDPEHLRLQGDVARALLAPPLRALWEATREPFVQPILDLAVPRMVFGRVALLGDAASIPRPHTAASTSKAAANALALGQAVTSHPGDLDGALREWEHGQLALGRQLGRQGKQLGDRSQFGD